MSHFISLPLVTEAIGEFLFSLICFTFPTRFCSVNMGGLGYAMGSSCGFFVLIFVDDFES